VVNIIIDGIIKMAAQLAVTARLILGCGMRGVVRLVGSKCRHRGALLQPLLSGHVSNWLQPSTLRRFHRHIIR
jgi:hypothetical protein